MYTISVSSPPIAIASHNAGGASTPKASSRGASTPNLFEHVVEAYTT